MFESTIAEEFSTIQALVIKEQQAAEQLIRESLSSNVTLINQIGEHIIESGGKRLRMLLVLLSAKAFGYNGLAHIQLAAIIELLHTATLLHDDVVDHSELRRGRQTANKIWGDHASVLVGDYLYSRAFQLVVQVGSMPVMDALVEASHQMAEGEVMQLVNCHNPDITEEDHMKVIAHKTGALFSAASQMGPILTGESAEKIQSMKHYGSYLGRAFQLVDDVLDYQVSAHQTGKNIGDDLAEGKPTLPLIRALTQLPCEKASLLRAAIREGKMDNIQTVIKMIESTDAITYTYQIAKQQADSAKNYLTRIPSSPYRDGLMQLIEFALARYY